jgi:hypothetical protein
VGELLPPFSFSLLSAAGELALWSREGVVVDVGDDGVVVTVADVEGFSTAVGSAAGIEYLAQLIDDYALGLYLAHEMIITNSRTSASTQESRRITRVACECLDAAN